MATNETPSPVRQWSPAQISNFLNPALPAYVATLHSAGFPRVLSMCYLREYGNLYLLHHHRCSDQL